MFYRMKWVGRKPGDRQQSGQRLADWPKLDMYGAADDGNHDTPKAEVVGKTGICGSERNRDPVRIVVGFPSIQIERLDGRCEIGYTMATLPPCRRSASTRLPND
jgi:hypothetical protein